jgi:hypothetical protein
MRRTALLVLPPLILHSSIHGVLSHDILVIGHPPLHILHFFAVRGKRVLSIVAGFLPDSSGFGSNLFCISMITRPHVLLNQT